MADFFDENGAFFDEFDKPPEPSDRLLLKKLREKEEGTIDGIIEANADENGYESDVSSDSEPSDWDENEQTEEQAENAAIIQQVSQVLKDLRKQSEQQSRVAEPEQADSGENSAEFAQMKTQLQSLANSIVSLRKKLKVLECTRFSGKEGPALQVIYMNTNFSRKYRNEIEAFLNHLVQRDSHEARETLPSIDDAQTTVCVEDTTTDIDSDVQKRRHQLAKAIGCCKVYQSYFIDVMGWPLVQSRPELTDGWEVPTYQQMFKLALPEKEPDGMQPTKEKFKASCFNCGGDHNLRDCTEKKDYGKIAAARQEFNKRTASSGSNATLKQKPSMDNDPRFARFRPGELSAELRQAMGIRNDELPPFIYRMRRLGYPPGWLKEAEMATSGLAMFDAEGREINMDGEVLEAGETSAVDGSVVYDFSKIVSFPGFNVQLPPNVKDECHRFGQPPMRPDQHKDHFIEYLRKSSGQRHTQSQPGKRRRPDDDDQGPSQKKRARTSRRSPVPMDTGADGSPRAKFGVGDSQEEDSESLDELEAKRLALKEQLTDDGELVSPGSCGSPEEGEIGQPPLPPSSETLPPPPSSPPASLEGDLAGSSSKTGKEFQTQAPLSRRVTLPVSDIPCKKTASNNTEMVQSKVEDEGLNFDAGVVNTPPQSSSKSRVASTPVMISELVAGSSGKGLPKYEKFADGITPHLNFDNLPNATGTYDKIRKFFGKLHKEKQD